MHFQVAWERLTKAHSKDPEIKKLKGKEARWYKARNLMNC